MLNKQYRHVQAFFGMAILKECIYRIKSWNLESTVYAGNLLERWSLVQIRWYLSKSIYFFFLFLKTTFMSFHNSVKHCE